MHIQIEPKLFFANERTFIKWMQMGVVLSSISIGIIAFSDEDSNAQYVAVGLLPLSLFIIGYGVRQFYWRSDKIKDRDNSRWDDPLGPVTMTVFLILALVAQLTLTVCI